MKSYSTRLISQFEAQYIAIADTVNKGFLSGRAILTTVDFVVLVGLVVSFFPDNKPGAVVARKVLFQWLEYQRIDSSIALPDAARIFNVASEPFFDFQPLCQRMIEFARAVRRESVARPAGDGQQPQTTPPSVDTEVR